jgi:hypothetical protein
MTYKFLIEACLSPTLVSLAVEAGHVESCLRDHVWLGFKDRRWVDFIIEGDYTLVTQNSVDFRGKGSYAQGDHYTALDIHTGLVCLNSTYPLTINRQQALFRYALEQLAVHPGLVNTVFEVFETEDGINTEIYDIPETHS